MPKRISQSSRLLLLLVSLLVISALPSVSHAKAAPAAKAKVENWNLRESAQGPRAHSNSSAVACASDPQVAALRRALTRRSDGQGQSITELSEAPGTCRLLRNSVNRGRSMMSHNSKRAHMFLVRQFFGKVSRPVAFASALQRSFVAIPVVGDQYLPRDPSFTTTAGWGDGLSGCHWGTWSHRIATGKCRVSTTSGQRTMAVKFSHPDAGGRWTRVTFDHRHTENLV